MNNVVTHPGYALADTAKCDDGIVGGIKRFYTQYATEGKCNDLVAKEFPRYAKDCKDQGELEASVEATSKLTGDACKTVEKPALLRIGGTLVGVAAAGYGGWYLMKKGKKSKR